MQPDRLRSAFHAAGITLLFLLIAILPFPYGAVLRPSELAIEVAGPLIAVLALLAARELVPLRLASLPLIALAALALLGVFQLVPLAPATLDRLSPKSLEVYRQAGTILGHDPVPRISIAPLETRQIALLTMGYIALFIGAALLLDTRRSRRWFLNLILIAAGVQIFFAAVTRDIGIEGVLHGRPDDRFAGRLRGMFINPNHLAGYLEIALGVAFALLWAEILTGQSRTTQPGEHHLERRFTPLAARALVWGLIATAIALTQSRGGIAATLVATLVTLCVAVLHPRVAMRRRTAIAIAAPAILGGIIFAIAVTREGSLLHFLAKDPRDLGGDIRVSIWQISIDAWRNFPTFGSGLGAFTDAFRMVQPRSMRFNVDQAHDELLQVLVTGGWIGASLAVIAIGSLLVLLFRAWWHQLHREESAVALAGAGALIALLLHGLVEFNFSIPAIPATLAPLLGCAWAAALDNWRSR